MKDKQYVIRLPRSRGIGGDLFYCEQSPAITTANPIEATRMGEDEANLMLSSIYARSQMHHQLFRGSMIVPESEMISPNKPKRLEIFFHVASGDSYEQAKEIREIVRAIIESKYPDAEVMADHWVMGEMNFCSVSNMQPKSDTVRDKMQEWVKWLILDTANKVRTREFEEVYDYV